MSSVPFASPVVSLDPSHIARRLEDVRGRTLSLIAGLDWETLKRQHIPILSPMVWDLGHLANFEEQWLCEQVGGHSPLESGLASMFDAVLNPRPTRKDLPLPVARTLWSYLRRVRTRSLQVLEDCASGRHQGPLVEEGFVFEMVAEHEEQHQETMLQLLQVLDAPTYLPAMCRPLPSGRNVLDSMVMIPAGAFQMGRSGRGFTYDNERPAHEVTLPGFLIDKTPVSCGQYLEFVEDGGYRRKQWWSEAGQEWVTRTRAEAPGNWKREGKTWQVRYMDREHELQPELPVVHVCYFEAEAYACWAGKRLPSEAEWEKAALWDPEVQVSRAYPWGDGFPDGQHANLDQLAFQPAPVGAYPGGASAYGVEQMVGDVWEWTSSDFRPYPGFAAFPYEAYSQIFFGSDYKVLRGGSWATRPAVARGTFRNWDYPVRRQIFSGFRCARDLE
jgi:iron(II)-dependent oxidoreductase